jgi:hypothetical protein
MPIETSSEPSSAAPPVVTPFTVSQDDTHKINVVAAAGTKQGSIATALATWKGGGTVAAMATSFKNADIAYHTSVIQSAAANGQPTPVGSFQVLHALGAI